MQLQKVVLSLLLVIAVTVPTPALADLTQCLTTKATEQDHLALLKWIFTVTAQHPDLKQYSNISAADQKEIDQALGNSLDRLVTVDCKDELVKAAITNPESIAKSFGVLGNIAMGSLMSNPEVAKAVSNMPNLLDMNKIEALFE